MMLYECLNNLLRQDQRITLVMYGKEGGITVTHTRFYIADMTVYEDDPMRETHTTVIKHCPKHDDRLHQRTVRDYAPILIYNGWIDIEINDSNAHDIKIVANQYPATIYNSTTNKQPKFRVVRLQFSCECPYYKVEIGKHFSIGRYAPKGLYFSIQGLGHTKKDRELFDTRFMRINRGLSIYLGKFFVRYQRKNPDSYGACSVVYRMSLSSFVKMKIKEGLK